MAQDFFNNPVDAPSLSQLLESIEQLAPKVNAAGLKADAVISAVERRLASAGIAVTCSRLVEPADIATEYDFEPHFLTDAMTDDQRCTADVQRSIELLYRQQGDHFRIVLREIVRWRGQDGGDHVEVIFEKPLLECSAGKKLQCLHLVRNLVLQISEKIKGQVSAVDMVFSNTPMLANNSLVDESKPAPPGGAPGIVHESGVKINVWRGVHNEKDWVTISKADHQRILELLGNNQRAHATVLLARLAKLPMNYARETLDHEKSFVDVKPMQ